MEDELLYCQQCEDPFVFSAKEAERFERLGFDPPRRCPDCRKHKIKDTEATLKRGDRRSARRFRESNWY